MKAAIITEEQIKAIEDALEYAADKIYCENNDDIIAEALAIVKSLKVSEPVAWRVGKSNFYTQEMAEIYSHEHKELLLPLYAGENL